MITTKSQFQLWACLILCITTLVRAAYDVSQKLPPQGELRVQLDLNLALKSGTGQSTQVGTAKQDIRNVVYTSYLEFNNDVSEIPDGQIYKMVRDAYGEIDAERTQYGFNAYQGKPTVMNIIAVEKYVLLASNQKGQTSFTLSVPNSPVAKSLKFCQCIFASELGYDGDWSCTNPGSRCRLANGYNCGEIMAAHLWFRLNSGYKSMVGLRGRILAIWSFEGELEPKKPCGTASADIWGCNRFVLDQGLTVIPNGTLTMDYVLANLAGGLVTRGQIPLCS